MDSNLTKEIIVLPEGDNNFSIFGRLAVIYAGPGNDTISVGPGEYEVFADGGNNTITADSGRT